MKLYEIINQEFESSSQVTNQYKSAKRKFVNQLKKMFPSFKVIVNSCPHFEITGFIQEGDRFVYFSTGDLRWKSSMLVRDAKSEKDYTGGQNTFVNYDTNFDVAFESRVKSLLDGRYER